MKYNDTGLDFRCLISLQCLTLDKTKLDFLIERYSFDATLSVGK